MRACGFETSIPSIRATPDVASVNPAMTSSSTDLPLPDGPTSVMNSPLLMVRSTPSSTAMRFDVTPSTVTVWPGFRLKDLRTALTAMRSMVISPSLRPA
ncbi:hypothetical protein D3C72_2150870 [compost metagenome]